MASFFKVQEKDIAESPTRSNEGNALKNNNKTLKQVQDDKKNNIMKINWGTGIVIAFIGFISFIMYFIITMSVSDKYNHDLVTEDYYAEELKYQNDIDKLKNANDLETNISFEKTAEGLLINFPEDLEYKKITGKMFLYRPSNKQLDFETAISLSKPYLLIPDNRLVDGRWNIKVDWKYQDKSYLYKETINY
ncbi:FixH family protein [Flavobacteriaceae bacterium SZ-1-7]|uniref:FixH family protein n=1 Tax=Tamlana sedimenti TaxID=3134126 RepID=UPI0031273B73